MNPEEFNKLTDWHRVEVTLRSGEIYDITAPRPIGGTKNHPELKMVFEGAVNILPDGKRGALIDNFRGPISKEDIAGIKYIKPKLQYQEEESRTHFVIGALFLIWVIYVLFF